MCACNDSRFNASAEKNVWHTRDYRTEISHANKFDVNEDKDAIARNNNFFVERKERERETGKNIEFYTM